MFCGNYTARDTPALPSDNVRKVCRQKPKDKAFLIIILATRAVFHIYEALCRRLVLLRDAQGSSGVWGWDGRWISAVPLLGWDMNLKEEKGDGKGRKSPVTPVGWLGSG